MNNAFSWCVLFLFLLCPWVESSGGELLDRIAEEGGKNYYLNKLTEDGLRSFDSLDSLGHDGSLPTLPDFLNWLVDHDEFDGDDSHGLVAAFIDLQKPRVLRRDLRSLVESRLRSADVLEVEYQVLNAKNVQAGTKEGPLGSSQANGLSLSGWTETLARKGQHYRLDTKYKTDNKEWHAISACDSQLLRSVLLSLSGLDKCRGDVRQLSDVNSFLPIGSPHRNALMLPAPTSMRTPGGAWSLISILKGATVYEAPVNIEGTNCIAVGTTAIQVYLSIEHDYAVRRADFFKYNRLSGTSGKPYVASQSYETVDNTEFQQTAGGSWLPSRSAYAKVENGQVIAQCETRLISVKNTTSFDEESFTNIFSEKNCFVDNMTTPKPSSSRFVSPDGQPSSPQVYKIEKQQKSSRWLLIAFNVAAVVILAIIVVRKMSRRED